MSRSGDGLREGEDEDEDGDGEEDGEEVDERFPGINKAHGFFEMVKRNQLERDQYHWAEEQRREAKRVEARGRQRRERMARKKPDKALYVPPGRHAERGAASITTCSEPTAKLYRLEIEATPGEWISLSVARQGDAYLTSESVGARCKLSLAQRLGLADLIREFEEKLLIHSL